jgi:hypothetical protein
MDTESGAQTIYECDFHCGFRGDFDSVSQHEAACVANTTPAPLQLDNVTASESSTEPRLLTGMFVCNALGVMLVAKGENQLALATDSTVLVSVLDLVRMLPPTAPNMI